VKRARFTPAAVVELEDAARRVERARPGWEPSTFITLARHHS
jgi:hypothetical protein